MSFWEPGVLLNGWIGAIFSQSKLLSKKFLSLLFGIGLSTAHAVSLSVSESSLILIYCDLYWLAYGGGGIIAQPAWLSRGNNKNPAPFI